MRSDLPIIVPFETLPLAWCWCLLNTAKRSGPVLVSISDVHDFGEDTPLRHTLDAVLDTGEKTVTTEDNAAMIFPSTLWQLCDGDRARFYDLYRRKTYPRLRRRAGNTKVQYGTYFMRMINYEGSKKQGKKQRLESKNQLEFLITRWLKRQKPRRDGKKGGRPRESELQIGMLDPPKDHCGQPVRGFPCLQQLSLSYDDDTLTLTALYPTQYVFERAFGNYVGLCRLGHFLAGEMGLSFTRLNCLVVAPSIGQVRVRDMKPVLDIAARLLKSAGETHDAG